MLVFDLIMLLVNYRTYGFVASHIRVNYPSRFLSHPIRVVRLYDVMTSYWLGIIRHNTLWNLLMSFLLLYFDLHISCLIFFQIFPLLLEQSVSIFIIILFLLSTSEESFIGGYGTFHTSLISDMVTVCAEVQIMCGVVFNKFIGAIYLL